MIKLFNSLPLIPLLLLLFTLMPALMYGADERYYADYVYIPPQSKSNKSVMEEKTRRRYPLPEERVRRYVSAADEGWHFSDFRNGTVSTKQLEEIEANQIALGREVRENVADLFTQVETEGDCQLFLARLRSDDATALRLRVNLSALRNEEELWLLDEQGDAAFGPYTRDQALAAGNWLPTTAGESVVLALKTQQEECPLLEVIAFSHFFKSIFDPGLRDPKPCHIDADTESNPKALENSTAVGILIIPSGNAQGYCTGTLINTHDESNEIPDSYLISSQHCFENKPDMEGMEVFWDYRSEDDDPNQLPRNHGAQLLSQNQPLDAALVKLHDPAPIGDRGRAWAGWDTLQPPRDLPVQCFHYPIASSMKLSRGHITSVETSVCRTVLCTALYEKQIRINWYEGVAEPGSSGSPLMLPDFNYRIIGTLSNGNEHSCRSSQNNFDHFSSFRLFFPQIQCHLIPGLDCKKPFQAQDKRCFLCRLFELKAEELAHLYTFRDQILQKSAFGRKCIEEYYARAPQLEAWLNENATAKEAFHLLLQGAVLWGKWMEDTTTAHNPE